ncbi:MAG: radical SAM protein [bacterium]
MIPSYKEYGAIKKEWGGRLPILLVYPDTYRAGMSNLAMHALYNILNSMDNVVCERCFWRKGKREKPLSIESKREAKDFSVVAFSVSFETDYINVVDFLKSSDIELYASNRVKDPLIIAGGIAITLNPEPIADFLDACVIGEAEGLVEQVMSAVYECLHTCNSREAILRVLDDIEGVYVPAFYKVEYSPDNKVKNMMHKFKKGKKVKRYVANLTRFASTAVYTNNTTFSGMHLQEVSRGCKYRCRFCISGYAYLPPRYAEIDTLKRALSSIPQQIKRIGIVSPMVTDYPYLNDLLKHIHTLGFKSSMSSMRADALERLDVDQLEITMDQFSTAIAPEAGTYRLRRILNKQLDDDQIISGIKILNRHKVSTLKLYFLIGIPGEKEEDIRAIATLSLKIKALFKGKSITISINPLIPKPFTPFQWIELIKPEDVKYRLGIIRQMLKSSDIKIEWERFYLLQAILSRGDRRLSRFLIYMSDTNRPINQAIINSNVDLDFYAFRRRDKDEILPWDFMDYGFKKDFLYKEYILGMKGITTPACNPDTCNMCGVCS